LTATLKVPSQEEKSTSEPKMKSKHLFFYLGAILFVFSCSVTLSQAARPTIELVTTFDYPETGDQTRPQKINDLGDTTGEIILPTGQIRGFVRFRDGTFTPPIIHPNEDGFLTDTRAINNSGLVAGFYVLANFAHGFFLSGDTFTPFDVPGALNTDIDALNDAGDFGGTIDIPGGNQAWISIGGVITTFSIPGSVTTTVFGLNNAAQAAGVYTDSAGISHGFFRDTDGNLIFPIDFPGSSQTLLFGINDRGWMVGRYVDNAGVTHGLFVPKPNRFIVFDFPGSSFTSLNGINHRGFICGRYLDGSGIEHGLVARVRETSIASQR